MIIRFSDSARSRGMTFVELLVATAIATMLFAGIATITLQIVRSFEALGNYHDLDNSSRHALDVLSRDIRQVKALTAYETNRLAFQDHDDAALVYEWSPVQRTLVRQKNGETTVLLEQCDYLRFGISQRSPSNNFNFYPVATPGTAKLVDVSWRCSRQILGKKLNTESVQTAKIVIRN
jgi:type II secretory pathway component PulJ